MTFFGLGSDETPLVSIITPVFNASRFLPFVVMSVQQQKNAPSYEHIFIDDNSTDDSLTLLLELAKSDKRIKIIQSEINGGVLKARNLGIKNAQGKYIAFLDADDYWMPEKLSIQTRFMEESNSALTFTDYRFVSEDGFLIGRLLIGPKIINLFKHLTTRSGLGCLTVMINHEVVSNFSFENYDPIVDKVEDFLAWLNIIKKYGPAIRVPYDLARYRVVAGSLSSNIFVKAEAVWKVYRYLEEMNLLSASYCFMRFAFSAYFKRYFYRPIWPLNSIDAKLTGDCNSLK